MCHLTQKTVVELNPTRLAWSVPYFAELADEENPANRGLVRHGGLSRLVSHVPKEYKPLYVKHVQKYLKMMDDPTGDLPRTIYAFGTRNTFQNLGLPGWHSGYPFPLLRRAADEPINSWVYQGLCKFRNGRLAIETVRFSDANKVPSVEIPGAGETAATDVEFVITGQPLLWDGEVTPLPLLAAITYDQRHCYHLLWEAWQTGLWPQFAHHKGIHDRLMDTFMGLLHRPLRERAAALADIAAKERLAVSDHYLHSSLGLRPDGTMVLVMMHGSLTQIGYVHRQLGSRRAILLDNGGSVGVAFWSRSAWKRGKWLAEGEDLQPRFIGQGSYFRPNGHAILIAELAADPVEPPLAPRPPADHPWTWRIS